MVPDDDIIPVQGGAAWVPPQLSSLVGAWVSGLSGAVLPLGTWGSAYGAAGTLVLAADAAVDTNGLVLDGSGDYAQSPAQLVYGNGTASFSIALWLNYTAFANFPVLLGRRNAAAANRVSIDIFPDTFVAVRSDGSSSDSLTFTTPPAGAWHHLAMTYDGSTLKAYTDGVKTGTDKASTRTVSLSGLTQIGLLPGGVTWRGWVDCAYIWTAALTQADITSLVTTDPYRRAVGT